MATTCDYIESLVSPFATTKIDEEDENYETAIHPIMDSIQRKILLNKRVPVSQIHIKKSDHEDDSDDDDCYDGSESDLEDDDGYESNLEDDDNGSERDLEDDDGNGSDLEDDGSGSYLEDDGKAKKYWLSSGDSDKDSDYFKYATTDKEDEDDDEDDDW